MEARLNKIKQKKFLVLAIGIVGVLMLAGGLYFYQRPIQINTPTDALNNYYDLISDDENELDPDFTQEVYYLNQCDAVLLHMDFFSYDDLEKDFTDGTLPEITIFRDVPTLTVYDSESYFDYIERHLSEQLPNFRVNDLTSYTRISDYLEQTKVEEVISSPMWDYLKPRISNPGSLISKYFREFCLNGSENDFASVEMSDGFVSLFKVKDDLPAVEFFDKSRSDIATQVLFAGSGEFLVVRYYVEGNKLFALQEKVDFYPKREALFFLSWNISGTRETTDITFTLENPEDNGEIQQWLQEFYLDNLQRLTQNQVVN